MNFFQSIGYSIVGDPTVKSIYSNGTDIVAQKFNELGIVTETLLVEVKQTVEVTLGKDKVGNYGGTIGRGIRTATRLANTSKVQLSMEFKEIMNGQRAGNLKNALYTTAGNISAEASKAFNYVYFAAATAAKAAEKFITSTLNMPFLAVPYYIVDPSKSPMNDQPIPTLG